MGTNETIKYFKSEKSSLAVQDKTSVHPYPDWASMKAYFCHGVSIPAPYFSAPVAPGHTHPYFMNPQPMLTPFGSPYTAMYPHGGLYSHSSATHIASVKLEVPVVPPPIKERFIEKRFKVLDDLGASIGCNANTARSSGNRSSESGDNGAEGSSDGSDVNSESGGTERRKRLFAEVLPSSASDEPPTISLGMTADKTTIIGKPCTVFRANLTPERDLRSSYVSKLKPGGEHNLPTTYPVEEKELKREKRKQSNRESAKRSRLRKQAEAEELGIKFGTLTAENTALRSEIIRLTESSDKLRSENSALMKTLRVVQLREKDGMVSVRTNYDEAPSVMIENLLARIDSCSTVCESNQIEEEPHDNSNGKLHQLLNPSPRSDLEDTRHSTIVQSTNGTTPLT